MSVSVNISLRGWFFPILRNVNFYITPVSAGLVPVVENILPADSNLLLWNLRCAVAGALPPIGPKGGYPRYSHARLGIACATLSAFVDNLNKISDEYPAMARAAVSVARKHDVDVWMSGTHVFGCALPFGSGNYR